MTSRDTNGRLDVQQRALSLAALRSQVVDVLVIGGGVVGAGSALDAASRGLTVGIIEARDWASGTSSRSSKLVHGGIRYLEQLDFALVREALVERGLLLRTLAPHLVRPVPFLYPVTTPVVERLYVGAGMLLYDLLSYSGGHAPGVGRHKHVSRRQLREQMPSLRASASRGGLRYFDAQVDDARLVATLVRTAVADGAFAASRVSAVAIRSSGDGPHVVSALDDESGEHFEIRARAIVNATGVWTEDSQLLLAASGDAGGDRAGASANLAVTMSKGVHIVVDRDRFRSQLGLILRAGASVLFVIPWGHSWLIGTTDTPWNYDKADPAATSADIDYLLDQVNRVLDRPIRRDDIRSVWSGLRPLVSGRTGSTARLSREHVVDVPRPGIAVVAGGKLTTYRVMARDAVDAALQGRLASPRSRTMTRPLLGADGLDAARAALPSLLESYDLSPEVGERLLGRYGDRVAEVLEPIRHDPGLALTIPNAAGAIRAEALYAVTHEGAMRLQDVLERRLRITMESSDFGLAAAPEVAALIRDPLGWDVPRVQAELALHRTFVDRFRAAMTFDDDESANAALAPSSDAPAERVAAHPTAGRVYPTSGTVRSPTRPARGSTA